MSATGEPGPAAPAPAEAGEAEAIASFVRDNPKVMKALESLVHTLVTCDTPHCTQILHVTRRSLEYLSNHPQAAASAPIGGTALHLDSAAAASASCIREALGQGIIPEAGLCDAEVARAILYTQAGRDYSYTSGRVDPLGDPHEDSMATMSRASLQHSGSVLFDTERAVCRETHDHTHSTGRTRERARAARQCAPDVVPAAMVGSDSGDSSSKPSTTLSAAQVCSPCAKDDAAATWSNIYQHVCTPLSGARPEFEDQ